FHVQHERILAVCGNRAAMPAREFNRAVVDDFDAPATASARSAAPARRRPRAGSPAAGTTHPRIGSLPAPSNLPANLLEAPPRSATIGPRRNTAATAAPRRSLRAGLARGRAPCNVSSGSACRTGAGLGLQNRWILARATDRRVRFPCVSDYL